MTTKPATTTKSTARKSAATSRPKTSATNATKAGAAKRSKLVLENSNGATVAVVKPSKSSKSSKSSKAAASAPERTALVTTLDDAASAKLVKLFETRNAANEAFDSAVCDLLRAKISPSAITKATGLGNSSVRRIGIRCGVEGVK